MSLLLDFEAVQTISFGEGHAFTASFSKDGVFCCDKVETGKFCGAGGKPKTAPRES